MNQKQMLILQAAATMYGEGGFHSVQGAVQAAVLMYNSVLKEVPEPRVAEGLGRRPEECVPPEVVISGFRGMGGKVYE